MQRFLNIRSTCARHIVPFHSTPKVPILRRPSSFFNILHWSNYVIVSLEKRKFHTSLWSSAEKLKTLKGDTRSSKINESSSVDEVVRWAEQFIEKEDALKLKIQKINGNALLQQTTDTLIRYVGIPSGPVSILMKEIDKLQPQAQGTPFNPLEYHLKFHNFEPNDDYTDILGREEQLQIIRTTLKNLYTTQKFEPIVICTSRGMGKTFLLKRIGYHQDKDNINMPLIQAAGRVGRVVDVECASFIQQMYDMKLLNLQLFWSFVVVKHLCKMFTGCVIDGIPFSEQNIYSISTGSSVPQKLRDWTDEMKRKDFEGICLEFIRLTNLAFCVNVNTRPVFLLDNVHELSLRKTNIPSSSNPELFHTELSLLLNRAASFRVPIILAGTTDGKLSLLTDYSNIRPVTVYLGIFSHKDIQFLGEQYAAHMNQENNKKVVWPNYLHDPILLPLIVSSCMVPRLVKMAVEACYATILKNGTPQSALVDYAAQASGYYIDAKKLVLSYSTEDFTKLALACSVHISLETTIPGTRLSIEDLEHTSIIFRSTSNTFVMPLLWWTTIHNTQDVKTLKHWKEINTKISKIVPGVQLEDLHISPSNLAHLQLHDTKMGHVYETLLAASLAVKHQLLKLQQPSRELVLSDIIDVLPASLFSIPIDWSKGVCFPEKEAKVGESEPNAICVNIKTHKAHHDVVASNIIASSFKFSMNWPSPCVIMPQLEMKPEPGEIMLPSKKLRLLLWCFLGADKNRPTYKNSPEVCEALKTGKLAFISGRNVVSNVTMELFKAQKLVYGTKQKVTKRKVDVQK